MLNKPLYLVISNEANGMQVVEVKKADLEVTLLWNQRDMRACYYFEFSNLSEVAVMYFCKGIMVGMRVIAVLR